MANDECSFCGTPIAVPPAKDRPPLCVAGPTVFICRDCVGICVEVMGVDQQWRDRQIAVLQGLGKASAGSH